MIFIPNFDNLLDMVVDDSLFDDNGIEWRKVWEAPGYYVNEYGDVASTYHGYLHILKSWPNQYGHQYVGLIGMDGRKIRRSVHRLVAEAFVPKTGKPDCNIVRHLDDNPENNCAENLAWGTQYDNRMDCVRHERDFVKSVYCYETDRIYRSCAEAAEDLGVSRSLITMCCQGKVHAALGKYHLCYLCDKEERDNDISRWTLKNGNYKPLRAINVKTGEELFFKSRKEASELLGVSDSGISSAITGRIRQSGGWRFIDGDE